MFTSEFRLRQTDIHILKTKWIISTAALRNFEQKFAVKRDLKSYALRTDRHTYVRTNHFLETAVAFADQKAPKFCTALCLKSGPKSYL